MDILDNKLSNFPALSKVVAELMAVWPEHKKYCETRFAKDDDAYLARTEEFAKLALVNIGESLTLYVSDYRWMCERFVEEELFFQREGHYRLSTFAEAYASVYSDLDYMSKYVRGILISQMIWEPHALAFDTFRTAFLAKMKPDTAYLEVGPGHGFFLYFASQTAAIAQLEAWDISDASILETKAALQRMNVTRDIKIVQQDVLKAPTRHEEFDAAVISEVLEHLERPDLALRSLHSALRAGGRIFINAPINSPAPDHIYLWRSTDEFTAFVEAQGFRIDETHFFPVTGYSLEKAKKYNASVSCVLIATKI